MKTQTCQKLTGLLAALALAFTALSARATNGSWNVDADGNWSTAANWLNNQIASDLDSTAWFTNALTGIHTVTLDSARTNGTLVFDNANATTTSAGWIFSGSGWTLTNSTATPGITVSNMNALFAGLDSINDVVVNAVITSPQGFVKNGPGTLTLNAANTLGPVRLNDGIINIGIAGAAGGSTQTVTYSGGGVRVPGSTTLIFAPTNNVLTSGTLISSNGTFDRFDGPWVGSGTMYIHSLNRLTIGNGNASTFAKFTGTIDLTDSSSGNEVRMNLGSGSPPYNLTNVTLNTGTNGGRFDFRTTVSPVSVRIGALVGGGSSRLDSSEQAAGTSLFWEIGYLNTSTTYGGSIRNRNNDPTRTGHLVKVGTGTLTLTSSNLYYGNTIISNGVLALGPIGTLLNSPTITVQSAGTFDVSALPTPFTLNGNSNTLAGSGIVTGAVAITTGTISPGVSAGNTATLRFTNDLSLDGTSGSTTNVFEIGTGVNDQILVGGNLTLAGSVIVRLVPTGPSIPNGTYNLYKWGGTLTGDTSNLSLSYAPQPGTIIVGTNLVTKTIFVQVSGAASTELVWRGDGAANVWNVNSTANWRATNGAIIVFNNGDNVTFDDSGSNNVPVDITGSVNPGNVLFTNITKDFEVTSTTGGKISGSAVITKKGAGIVILSADNDNNGLTTIVGGTLQIGNGGSSGALGSGTISNGATLVFNRDTAANNGVIAGPGTVVQTGSGTLTLSGVNTYTGNTVVSNGTLNIGGASALGSGTLVLAGGQASAGAIALANPINVVGDSTLNNSTGESQFTSDSMTGTAGKILTLTGGTTRFTGTGFTMNCDIVLAITAFQSYNQNGDQIFNGVISGSGIYRRRWPVSDLGNTGTSIMNGANTYSGGTLLREGSIGFGISSVSSTPPTIDSGPIGTGTMTQDTGTIYTSVFAAGGARNVGNPIVLNTTGPAFTIKGSFGLTLSGTIDLGGGDKTLAIENTAATILTGDISGGNIMKSGNGSLYINGNNNAGATTVTTGALGGTGIFAGPVTLNSGSTLAPGASIGTLTINSDLSIGGNLAIEVNKSLAQSNDLVSVTGVLTNTGAGTLSVTNLGPALVVGDKFTLFSIPVLNGAALTVTGGGVNWTNKLAVDGSIQVLSVASTTAGYPTNLSFNVSGGMLTLTWPGTHLGWFLQNQTNSLNVGLTTPTNAWLDVPGSDVTTQKVVTISPANPSVFYRLRHP